MYLRLSRKCENIWIDVCENYRLSQTIWDRVIYRKTHLSYRIRITRGKIPRVKFKHTITHSAEIKCQIIIKVFILVMIENDEYLKQ